MKCDCRLRKEYYKGNIFRSSGIEEQRRRRRGTFPASIKRGDAKPVTMCGFSPLEPRCGDRGEGLRVTRIQFSHGEQTRTLVPKSFFLRTPSFFLSIFRIHRRARVFLAPPSSLARFLSLARGRRLRNAHVGSEDLADSGKQMGAGLPLQRPAFSWSPRGTYTSLNKQFGILRGLCRSGTDM